MHLCPNCAAELIPGAKFCHRCGEKVIEKTKPCPVCVKDNPIASVFCHHCGFHFEGKRQQHAYEPLFPLHYNRSTMTDQVKTLFFKSLRQRVGEEHDPARYSEIVDRFYQSRFRELYDVRAHQIAEDAWLQWDRFGTEALPAIDALMSEAFDGLLDYFIIRFCPDLTGMVLPSAILGYESAQPGQTDIRIMMHDYLDLEREPEVTYIDFVSMPVDLLDTACKSFLKADRDETVFFITDLSLKGNCKEGFAMTDKAIYWRAPYAKACRVAFRELYQIQKVKDWLLINEQFFTANPSLNLKLFKLLKKLQRWYTVKGNTETRRGAGTMS